jgi:hypothetical protein
MVDVPELLRNALLIVVGWIVLSLPVALLVGRILGAGGAAPTPRTGRADEDEQLVA